MKFYDKHFKPFSSTTEIGPIMQVAATECFHCGKTIRFPVRPEFIDWERIARSYEKRLKEIMADFEQMNRDVEVLHGENPVAQYMCNRLHLMVEDIMNRMDDHRRESGE